MSHEKISLQKANSKSLMIYLIHVFIAMVLMDQSKHFFSLKISHLMKEKMK
jgi:hypothetical protein